MLLLVVVFTFMSKATAQDYTEKVSKSLIIEDTRQLVRYAEESHPNPYQNFGGKIAFHREFQKILSLIPKEGMTQTEFYNLLMPFIAKIGDMHTGLINPVKPHQNGPGLPLKFKIIEENLVVVEVPSNEFKGLLGSKLVSLNDIPFFKLLERQTKLRGIENKPGELVFLSISLKTSNGIKNLIPEWSANEKITAEFRLKSGDNLKQEFQISSDIEGDAITVPTKAFKPSTEKSDVVYNFVNTKQTALLVISNMERYREASESWFAEGMEGAAEYSGIAYQYFNKEEPPTNREDLLKGIPSATETFVSLIQDMKRNNTKNLIVDLRDNTGGNSIMKEILIYFLFGKDGLLSMNTGYQIIKYSDLYFQTYSTDSLSIINKHRDIQLTGDDYDFKKEKDFYENDVDLEQVEEYLKSSSTFWSVYESGKYHMPTVQLENIIVLCNPYTTSSGFNLLTSLTEKGAMVLGTASAQPGNNFGDILFFQLNNSKIKGYVSFKQNITFPNDPVKGKCLLPDYPLTYEKFAAYNYDADSEIIYAFEVLNACINKENKIKKIVFMKQKIE